MSQQSETLQLFLSYRSELLRQANRITRDRAQAEDVLQEAWLRFRAALAERQMDEPLGYLSRIVRNLALDSARRSGLESRLFQTEGDADPLQVPSETPSQEAAVISGFELRAVENALARMPERMRAAVRMHRIEGIKLKDIAKQLGISVTSAHGLVAEGVTRCRAALRDRQ
ncbi:MULTISPECIES: sigma-70 family RNA polymerase sigma factor [Sphingomonas]|uniref:RNA polymerase sigma-70 factor (ECF subfamily) n=1 Tax=Sphingomonas trueperi TaxID=53317 RepID=A0A7X5Y1T5_9SPHN|nr:MULTISPECIES: sigma-70 family RNA polymerase sigma factor [Sphingomonas]NJB99518.1 RNA polymerase sigma-70 factor (ECF subfamily) [Sphingomonas trueperi]